MSSAEKPAKLIAFYLPQFHRTPENDAFWGDGFTEWTNVRKAQPQFPGHYQPHVPLDHDYYDLANPSTLVRQAELAAQFGIHGFCYYFYWFDGRRVLEKPVERMLASREPDFPFCLCWANENWTRRWDGQEQEILIEQKYNKTKEIIMSLMPYFKDSRYIKIEGRPVFLIYRPSEIPQFGETIEAWRLVAREQGIDPFFVGNITNSYNDLCMPFLDGIYEFPPNDMPAHDIRYKIKGESIPSTQIIDYEAFMAMRQVCRNEPHAVFRAAMPSWDNTARRGASSRVFVNSSPESFRIWLSALIAGSEGQPPDRRMIFINAWNEWGEGAHLEPDERDGFQWLEACAGALRASIEGGPEYLSEQGRIWEDGFTGNQNVLLQLADADTGSGKIDLAARMLEAIPEADQDTLFHLIEAKIALSQGNIDTAYAKIWKSIDLNPGVAELFFQQGRLLMQVVKWQEAEAVFERAYAAIDDRHMIAKPLRKSVCRNLAHAALTQGKPERARHWAEEGRSCPPVLDDHLLVGRIAFAWSDWQTARTAFEEALAVKPDHIPARRRLVEVLLKLNSAGEAIGAIHALIALQPDDAASHSLLAHVLTRQNRLTDAIAAARKAVDLNDAEPRYLMQLCNLLHREGQLDEAEVKVRCLVSLAPSMANAHHLLGNILVRTGSLVEAEAALRRAIEIEPLLANGHFALSVVLNRTGRTEDALASATRAMELVPAEERFHQHRDRLLERRKAAMD